MKDGCKCSTSVSLILCADRIASFRVGDTVKNAYHTNPKNTVVEAKRLIGHRFEDPDVKKDMKRGLFAVVSKAGRPVIQVEQKGDKTFVRPRTKLSRLYNSNLSLLDPRRNLRHGPWLNEGDCLGQITHAIVTALACFDDAQR